MDNSPSFLKIQHLSFSQLNLYQECPFKYYLQYILKRKQQDRIEFKIGGNFHSGMQEMYIHKDYEKGKIKFRNTCMELGIETSGAVDNLTSNMYLYSERHLTKYLEGVVGTEVKFEIKLPKIEVPLIGYIDVLLNRGFIDHKTTSDPDPKKSYKLKQLVTYAIWFFHEFKMLPSIAEIHYFSKNFSGDRAIGVISEEITYDMINMVILEYQQLWQDIKNERWTPNLAAWKQNDPDYTLACMYAEKMSS